MSGSEAVDSLNEFTFVPIPDVVKLGRGKFEDQVRVLEALKLAKGELAITYPEQVLLKKYGIKKVAAYEGSLKMKAKKMGMKVSVSTKHGNVYIYKR